MVVVLAKKLARDTAAAAAVGKSRWKTEKHVAGKRHKEKGSTGAVGRRRSYGSLWWPEKLLEKEKRPPK